MAGKLDISKKKCMTPKFRVSFPSVFEPKAFEGQEAKYSIVMLFKKGEADLKAMKQAVQNVAEEKWGPKEKWPKNLRTPFRDGDEKSDTEGYEGHIFVSASNKLKPGLVDQATHPILDREAFYAGCYARATVIAFAYDQKGNKGVSFSLQNIQKLADGPSLSGRKAASEEFDSVEDESDDLSNYSNEDDL